MLIGEKVCLGPILTGDGPFLFSWMNNRGLAYGNGPYRPMSQLAFDEWFNGIAKDPRRVVFALRSRSDMKLLGYVQIINIDAPFRSAELGILIGEEAEQGRGFGQEAIALAIEFCWSDLNLQRLSLLVVGENARAGHVYEKVGFEVEGRMRRAAYANGQYVDIVVMGKLRVETTL